MSFILDLEKTVGKAAIIQQRHYNTQISSSLKCNNAFLKLYSVICQSCSVEAHINISVGQFLSDFSRILKIVSVLCLIKSQKYCKETQGSLKVNSGHI